MVNQNFINHWGISSKIITEEAEKKGLQVKILSSENNLFSIYDGKKTVLCKSVDCGLNSALGSKIADNKELSYLIGEENNIKVPKSIYLDRNELADGFDFSNIILQYPVVSKPIDGAHGDGVAIDLMNKSDIEKGVNFSFSDSSVTRIVIQEQIKGEDYRIIVLSGKVVAVAKRIPAHIIGDGRKTINQLIEKENKNPKRGTEGEYNAAMSQIKADSELEDCITSVGYSLDSVPKKEERVYVRKNANISTGGISQDMTDQIHDSIKQEAIKIAKICGLGFCGVDFFCDDITKPLKDGSGAIIEINSTPGIRMHHFPGIGKARNVAGDLLTELFN